MVSVLLRFLGFNLLSEFGARSSNRTARTVSVAVLLAANLLPVVAVLRGYAGMGDVFVVYWFENVVVGAVTVIKILTCTQPATAWNHAGTAAFFTVHYGIFTVVHGVFTAMFVHLSGGLHTSPQRLLGLMAAMTVSHVVSLWLNWFGSGERHAYSPEKAMWLPYPRMLVLHVAVIGTGFLVFSMTGGYGSPQALAAVALLCGLKTGVDVALHLRERFRATATRVELLAQPA